MMARRKRGSGRTKPSGGRGGRKTPQKWCDGQLTFAWFAPPRPDDIEPATKEWQLSFAWYTPRKGGPR